MQSRLPKRLVKPKHRLAIDLNLLPYYGKPTAREAPYIYRSKAKAGTTSFCVYGAVYVIIPQLNRPIFAATGKLLTMAWENLLAQAPGKPVQSSALSHTPSQLVVECNRQLAVQLAQAQPSQESLFYAF